MLYISGAIAILLANIVVQGSPNKDESGIFAKRRQEVDRRYFYYHWTATIFRQEDGIAVRKIVSEEVRNVVDARQFELLQVAFEKRDQRQRELLDSIAWFEIGDKRNRLLTQGWKRDALDKFYPLPDGWAEPTKEQCEEALKTKGFELMGLFAV